MMDRVRGVGAAAIVASCAGGPLAMMMAAIGKLLSGEPVDLEPSLIVVVPATIVLGTAIGWLLAIVPNLLGTMMLGWLGRFNVGMRLPAAWAIVGAAAGGVPAWLSIGPYDSFGMPAAMAGIGAMSALFCRSRVRWEESEATDISAASAELTPAHPPATP